VERNLDMTSPETINLQYANFPPYPNPVPDELEIYAQRYRASRGMPTQGPQPALVYIAVDKHPEDRGRIGRTPEADRILMVGEVPASYQTATGIVSVNDALGKLADEVTELAIERLGLRQTRAEIIFGFVPALNTEGRPVWGHCLESSRLLTPAPTRPQDTARKTIEVGGDAQSPSP
jgi:hypothetical protein